MDFPLSSEIWPKRGTLRNGTLFERRMSGRPIFGNGSSFWPTPTIDGNHNYKGASRTSGDGLATVALRWPTPTVQDARNLGVPSQHERNTPPLNVLASVWQTPTAESSMLKSRPNGRYDLGLRGQAGSFHPDRGIVRDGPPTSQTVVLNPRFVERLMGFPDEWTDCTSSVMPSFHSWRRLHLAALRRGLGWTSEGDE